MKVELCAFSGYKIYPGHGRTLVKIDGKSYKFLSSKTQKGHDLKRNPRKITWTVLYRRKHKKGIEEDVTKKRTKKTQKFQRAVVGASLTDILAKRNQKPEVRKAQREQAIRAAKETKKTTKPAAAKKAAPKDAKVQKTQQKATKNVTKGAPRVGGKQEKTNKMGRMHAPGKGISQSALPYRRTVPQWMKMSSDEVKDQIFKLAKKGLTPSQIGVILRDSHGVAQVRFITGNKILRILKSKALAPDLPEDMYFLIKKAVSIRKHLERNRKDKDAKFRLILVESRIHRLARYYKTKSVLPPTWKYESSTASTLVA